MSRYLSTSIILLLLFSGCAQKNIATPKVSSMQKGSSKILPFKYEDDYIIEALYYKSRGDFAKAYAMFDELYYKTNKIEYKIEALKLLIGLQQYQKAYKDLESLIKKYPNNTKLYRLMAITDIKLHQDDEALIAAKKALSLNPDNPKNSDLVASIYLYTGFAKKAYDTYNTYYMHHHDDDTVTKMAAILLQKLHNKTKAVELLETHSKMIGCSKIVCLSLAQIYRDDNNLASLATVYERLYKTDGKSKYAKQAAEIYVYQKEYSKAIALLKESHADNRLLLAIYKQNKQFTKAAKLAKAMYDSSLDPLWMAEYSVLFYEASPDKNDPKVIHKVISSLNEAFKEGVDDPLYYNYLGYLLIDHNIDVKRGIKLVLKALKKDPDSAFYIDSLAWGYYKMGMCTKAKKQMKRVVEKLGLKDKEIKAHWTKINQCRSKTK